MQSWTIKILVHTTDFSVGNLIILCGGFLLRLPLFNGIQYMSCLPDAESASISHVTDLLQVRSGKMCGK